MEYDEERKRQMIPQSDMTLEDYQYIEGYSGVF